jgi:hypothetical protein
MTAKSFAGALRRGKIDEAQEHEIVVLMDNLAFRLTEVGSPLFLTKQKLQQFLSRI